MERREEIPACAPALLVLDSYQIDPESARIQTNTKRLVAMHDFGPLPEQAELVLTTDPGLVGTRPGVDGGLGLSCLGPDYWGLPEVREAHPQVRMALVTTGGGDPGGHAVAIARAVHGALPKAEVVLVCGPHAGLAEVDDIRVLDRPSSMLRPLLEADLAVTSAGNTLLEALAVGTPTVALRMAENQRAVAEGIARQGATELFAPDAHEAIQSAVRRLAADRDARRTRARLGQELVDGYGALRTAFLITQLLES